jgi:hypothetical protein
MASLSTSCVLTEGKRVDVLNRDLYKKILANLGWMTVHFDSDYTQLVTPETKMITDNDSDNGNNGQEENADTEWGEGVVSLYCRILAHFLVHEKHFVMCIVPSSTPLNWMS